MKAWMTYAIGGEKISQQMDLIEDKSQPNRENLLVALMPNHTYQTIHGFGGALTDASGYVYSLMDEKTRQDVVKTYFDPECMGYVWGRTSIDSCDFSKDMYAAGDDPEDTQLEHMDYSRADRYMLPLFADAQRAAGKPLKMMLTPWTPPAWMKTNADRKHGGRLKEEYAPLWAEYICRYIRHYMDYGMDVRLLSAQNEPHAVQTWDSCIYSDEEEKCFVRDHLIPALKKHGLDQRISLLIWDHNKEHMLQRAEHIMADDGLKNEIGGVAFHWYSGDHFDSIRMTAEAFPGKRIVFTEGCVEHSIYGSDAELIGAVHYAHEYIGDLNAGADTMIDWNILLDAKGGPNHVGNFCDAPMMYDTEKGVLHKKLSLDYIGHFSKAIKPGAVRIGVSCFGREIEATAARNPDGSIAAVLLNTMDREISAFLRIEGKHYPFTLPARGIMTCLT